MFIFYREKLFFHKRVVYYFACLHGTNIQNNFSKTQCLESRSFDSLRQRSPFFLLKIFIYLFFSLETKEKNKEFLKDCTNLYKLVIHIYNFSQS